MSKKKDSGHKPITLREVESEIESLEADEPRPEPQGDLAKVLHDFMQQQSRQHAELLAAFQNASQAQQGALVSLKDTLTDPRPKSPPRANVPPLVHPDGIFVDEAHEEDADDSSSGSFEGWDYPEPAQPLQEVVEPPVLPSTSKAPDAGAAAPIQLEGLFSQDSDPNWDPPADLMAWMAERANKEIKPAVLKEINDNFVPQEKFK